MRQLDYLRNMDSRILLGFVEENQGDTRLDYFKRESDSVAISCSKLIRTLRGLERQNYQYSFMDTEHSCLVLLKEGFQARKDISEDFCNYVLKVKSQGTTIGEPENE